MIYGGICLDNNITVSENLLNDISGMLCWENSISHTFKLKSFQSVYLNDTRLPYLKKDCYFFDEENEILVLIDGSIYNKNEILNSLGLTQSNFDTPKLISKAFLNWGESFVKMLNGDFAICVFNKKKNQVYFYRDQLGIRPLAICRIGSVIYFSTDIMGFCKALYFNKKIDSKYLLNLFLGEGSEYAILPNNKVKKIKPGHYLNATLDCQVITKYWNPKEVKKDNQLSITTAVNELRLLLIDAVKIRSDKRYFASAHISGGLDSGIVAALTRNEYKEQQKFYGFSWTPEISVESDYIAFDELGLVNSICKQHEIIPIHANFTIDDYFTFMSNWRYSSELIYEKKIIEAANTNGVNLIFSGWGGDEFISIGNRGIDSDLFKELNWGSFLKKNPLSQPKKALSALLFNVIFPSARRGYLKYKTDPGIYKYLRKGMDSNIIPYTERISYDSRRRVHLHMLETCHIASRCEDWYVHGQRNGTEYRYPLLDKRIIEYILKVPSKCMVEGNNNRIILRKICNGILPENVIANHSKEDPIKSYFLSKIATEAANILKGEINDFKMNIDLDFIDFKLLEDTIQKNEKIKNYKINEEILLILYYIKLAHEFSKGYYQ